MYISLRVGDTAVRGADLLWAQRQRRSQDVHGTTRPTAAAAAATPQRPQVSSVVVGAAWRQVLAVVDDRAAHRRGTATETRPQDASQTAAVAARRRRARSTDRARHRDVPAVVCGPGAWDLRHRETARLRASRAFQLHELRQLAVAAAQHQCHRLLTASGSADHRVTYAYSLHCSFCTVVLYLDGLHTPSNNAVSPTERFSLKPNSITLASSELAPNMFGASSELASVIEFGYYLNTMLHSIGTLYKYTAYNWWSLTSNYCWLHFA